MAFCIKACVRHCRSATYHELFKTTVVLYFLLINYQRIYHVFYIFNAFSVPVLQIFIHKSYCILTVIRF